MKIKHLILGLSLTATLFALGSCEDDLTKVGTSIQDEDDKISVKVDSFYIEASTVLMDAVYARSDTSLLGEFYDPLYGSLKSDYICQFYCPENYRFLHTPLDGKIDSVDFRIYYHKWIGDSLAPMRAEIYPVDKPLDKNFYTNINPDEYVNMFNSYGSQTYTAYDRSVPDSIRYHQDGFYPMVLIRMPQSLGQSFYDETINNPATFNNQESFNEFFPGLYITNTFGAGNIIGVDVSYFTIYYRYMGKGSAGQDSIMHSTETFSVTKEVIQLNRFKNTDMGSLLEPSEEYTYMKTPAGVGTKVVIPAKEIAPLVEGRILNNLPLTFYAMPQDEYEYALQVPPYLLLLPADSVKSFFENNKVNDNVTSFLATYDSSKNYYKFGNISNVLKKHIENSSEENLVLMAFPVNPKIEPASYYSESYTTAVNHYLFPSGLKLRKDPAVRKLAVTSSRYGTTNP